MTGWGPVNMDERTGLLRPNNLAKRPVGFDLHAFEKQSRRFSVPRTANLIGFEQKLLLVEEYHRSCTEQ